MHACTMKTGIPIYLLHLHLHLHLHPHPINLATLTRTHTHTRSTTKGRIYVYHTVPYHTLHLGLLPTPNSQLPNFPSQPKPTLSHSPSFFLPSLLPSFLLFSIRWRFQLRSFVRSGMNKLIKKKERGGKRLIPSARSPSLVSFKVSRSQRTVQGKRGF